MNSLAQPMKWEKWFWPLFAIGIFLLLWHLSIHWTHTKIFPSPFEVARASVELARKGVLVRYVVDSLRRVGTGYLSAAALAIPAGLFLGWYPAAASVVNPTIQILRPISPIAWIPVSILWFGVGDLAADYLI